MEFNRKYYGYSIKYLSMFDINMYIPNESSGMNLLDVSNINPSTIYVYDLLRYIDYNKLFNTIIFRKDTINALKLNYDIISSNRNFSDSIFQSILPKQPGTEMNLKYSEVICLRLKPHLGRIEYKFKTIDFGVLDNYTIYIYTCNFNDYIFNKDSELIGINLLLNSIKFEFDNYKEFMLKNHLTSML